MHDFLLTMQIIIMKLGKIIFPISLNIPSKSHLLFLWPSGMSIQIVMHNQSIMFIIITHIIIIDK